MKLTMKEKKDNSKTEDDTLFGLLSSYKIYNTYFRILINEDKNNLLIQLTSNPRYWPKLEDEKYKEYRLLKRSEIGIEKLSVKYLLPEHLIDQMGPTLGCKIPEDDAIISSNLNTDGFYSIETKLTYLHDILSVINKIIDLSPQKKYEILEKSLSKNT